jgi:hypothetical protein
MSADCCAFHGPFVSADFAAIDAAVGPAVDAAYPATNIITNCTADFSTL